MHALTPLFHAPWVLLLIGIVVLLFVVGPLIQSSTWPYVAKALLTPAEQKLYRQLKLALPEYIILAQVSLGQAIGIQASGRRRLEARNRISQKSLDFVVCRSPRTRG